MELRENSLEILCKNKEALTKIKLKELLHILKITLNELCKYCKEEKFNPALCVDAKRIFQQTIFKMIKGNFFIEYPTREDRLIYYLDLEIINKLLLELLIISLKEKKIILN